MVKFRSLKWTLVSQKASNANSEVGIIQLHLILLSFFHLGSTDALAGAELCTSTAPGSVPAPPKNSNGQIVQVPAQLGQQISPGHGSLRLPLNSARGHLITTAYQGIGRRETQMWPEERGAASVLALPPFVYAHFCCRQAEDICILLYMLV